MNPGLWLVPVVVLGYPLVAGVVAALAAMTEDGTLTHDPAWRYGRAKCGAFYIGGGEARCPGCAARFGIRWVSWLWPVSVPFLLVVGAIYGTWKMMRGIYWKAAGWQLPPPLDDEEEDVP